MATFWLQNGNTDDECAGPLLQFGHHDDRGASLAPNHAPEVTEGLRKRSLRRHVGVRLPVTVHEISTAIIKRTFNSCNDHNIMSMCLNLSFSGIFNGRLRRSLIHLRALLKDLLLEAEDLVLSYLSSLLVGKS